MMPTDQLARIFALQDGSMENKDLQNEVELLNARIEQLERERDAAEGFAAMAAHELMAPLVLTEACVAMAGDSLNRAEAPELLQAFDVLGRGAARTRQLIEVLLHEARTGGGPLGRELVDLEELARDCVALLAPDVEARSADITLEPLPTVHGERELLSGLLTNLLQNALKFNPRQGGGIAVGAERDGDGWWTVWVESEGPAIPPEDRERIFEPYQRGRGERRTRGAGLGLAICRRIVERHGGNIGVTDARGPAEGNRFYFTLPA
jgi:signal transduction histidine kinase